MRWELGDRANKPYPKLKRPKKSDKVILATDPDREAISWHLMEYFNEKNLIKGKAVERVTFNQITKIQLQMRLPIRVRLTKIWLMPIWRAVRWIIWLGLIFTRFMA